MKLITLNLWQGRLFRNYPKFFKQQQADIIFLQEAYISDKDIPTLELFNNALSVKKASKLEHLFASPTHGYMVMGSKVQFVNCILSRYPLETQDTVFTNGEYIELADPEQYIGNVRNAQIATIVINNKKLTLVNHHAYWEPTPAGSAVSTDKLQVLSNSLQNTTGPLIIAGDFNLNSDSQAIKTFTSSLNVTNLNEQYGLKNTLSNQVTPHMADCDHIFVNPDVRVKDLKVSDELLSDHKALIFEFDV